LTASAASRSCGWPPPRGRAATALWRVILFGSLVAEIPTRRSDADLLVVPSDGNHPEPRDRVPEVPRDTREKESTR
jgi:hypothetical protein